MPLRLKAVEVSCINRGLLWGALKEENRSLLPPPRHSAWKPLRLLRPPVGLHFGFPALEMPESCTRRPGPQAQAEWAVLVQLGEAARRTPQHGSGQVRGVPAQGVSRVSN